MNLLAWLLSLSILVVLLVQAVEFQRSTVCRQEAWRKALELKTRETISNPKPIERDWHLGCRLHLVRHQQEVTWQRLPKLQHHKFELPLEGQL